MSPVVVTKDDKSVHRHSSRKLIVPACNYEEKVETVLGPEMATSEASAIWSQKSRDFKGPTPSNGPSNGFSRIKIIKSKDRIKNMYIGNFIYMSFCILYCILCVLYSDMKSA